MFRSYIKLFISALELRILNINVPLIKVSITDGVRLILHYKDILSFFMAAIMKPSEMADGTQDIECFNILIHN